jgi:hypothetical protein
MAESRAGDSGRERSPWLLETAAVILLLLDMALGAIGEARAATSFGEWTGAILAPPVILLMVVVVVRAFKWVRTRRGTAQLAIGVVLFGFVGECGSLGKAVEEAVQAVDPAARAKKIAKEAGTKLPRQVDSETELFAIAADGPIIIYKYRLVHPSAAVSKEAMAAVQPELVNRACNHLVTRKLLQDGLVFRHVYLGSDAQLITTFDIRESDCNLEAGGRLTSG